MLREPRRKGRIDISCHAREDAADDEVAVSQVALETADEIVRERLDLLMQPLPVTVCTRAVASARHRAQQSHRVAARRAAGDLSRAEDGRRVRNVSLGEIVGGEVRRPSARARRVASRSRCIASTLLQKLQLKLPKSNTCAPSTKNGRFSGKNVSNAERLSTAGSTSTCPKSGLNVASSVRFDVTRSRRSSPARIVGRPCVSNGVAGAVGKRRRFRAGVGHQLEVRRGRRNAQSLEMAEARRPARFVLVPERPIVFLVAPLDEATHLQPPRLHRVAREAELAVRNADLRRPAIGVDLRRRFPDRIPRLSQHDVADADVVRLRAGRIELEERSAQVVVIASR